jgi:dedicated sortase system histidine kinase
MSRPRFWHRVRFKLLLVSLTLLGIPWAGYRFIQETEHFLRDAQEQALQTTASSVANVMHGHDDLFHGVARPGSVLTFRNLYLHELAKPPQLDGYRDEWPGLEHNFTVLQSVDDSLEARMLLGRHARSAYLLIGVRDRRVSYGDAGDAIELALTDAAGGLERLRIRPQAPGWVAARRVPQPGSEEAPDSYDPAIRGEWQNSPDGYTVELRMPLERINGRLSLRFLDSDTGQVLASGHMFPIEDIGHVVERSAALDRVLAEVTPPATRVWVTDHQGLVLASAGRLDLDAPLAAGAGEMPWFVRDLITAILPRDADAVADIASDQTHLFLGPVVEALSGRPASLRRQPARGNAVVVSAAVPIRSSSGVRGAVLVEQTTHAILSIQNLALQRLFGVTLILFAVTSLGLLAFASLLASRITGLRDHVESAVSHDGRIVGRLPEEHARDEIGDLGRSFASVLHRLNAYNHYLEAMAARLAHELRTPLAVVRSSLDNAEQVPAEERPLYLERARHGAERLERILDRLREATGLEQALRQAEPIEFDLAALLRLQVESLRTLYPDARIALDCPDTPVTVKGVPDLVSQAMDKLAANAVDFHVPGSTIRTSLHAGPREVVLSVRNQGPPLPADRDVFQSMFSSRIGRQSEPHLGLGLYLVRLICEYHGGRAEAVDRSEPDGVEVRLYLPREAR